jgi:anaerobic ribonucleoside-triphosphate reductase activating protein
MQTLIRVNGVVEESIVDGPGLRYVVFTQGCPHGCKGCHNPETHDFAGGYLLDTAKIIAAIAENPLLSGVTLSGGEPFMQPAPLCSIAEAVKASGKNVMIFSGFVFEQLLEMEQKKPDVQRLLSLCDTLVDGPYMEEQRNLELAFRGSENQRVLTRDSMEALRRTAG